MASRITWTIALFAAAVLPSCGNDDKPPVDAPIVVDSGPGTDGSACGGTIGFVQACTTDNECMSCVCHSFGHSKVCSQACVVDADCPAPSGGCTTGFCRP